MAESAQKSSQAPQAANAGRQHEPVRRAPAGAGMAGQGLTSLQADGGNQATSSLLAGAFNGGNGDGKPLPPPLRAEMESRFGTAFADVRVHDDPSAHLSAAQLDAKAYTHGSHVVFSADRYAPHTRCGKRLLAHELAHVVQQRRGGAAPPLDAAAPHESAADTAADAFAHGDGAIAVAGATGTGIARDAEDSSWGASLRRKAQALKAAIPEKYRVKIAQAADVVADKTVDALASPLGPAAMYAADGLGSSLLHGAEKAATGEKGATDDLKNFGRDKVQEGLGAVKGVVTQVTEVADTAMWIGNEYKEARDKVAAKVGKEGSVSNTIAKGAMDGVMNLVPGMSALPATAQMSDSAKKLGLIDPETKQASLSAPLTEKFNDWAKSAEQSLGASPREPEMFSPMEKAELASNIASQVALSFVGAEEVKVAMNVVGAIGGLRGVVESIRHDPNWKTSSRFWGSLIGLALSVVGLKHTMAAGKIATLILKYGWVAAAIPPLAQMAADYVNPNLTEEERQQRMKQGYLAAINVLKDAVLHVAQSQGGSTAKKAGAPGEHGGPSEGGSGAPVHEDASALKPGATNTDAGAQTGAEGAAPKAASPSSTTAGAEAQTPARTTPAAADPATSAAPSQAGTTASAKPSPAGTKSSEVAPLQRANRPATSDASKALKSNLAKQRADKAGTVPRIGRGKNGRSVVEPPSSEPMQHAVPQEVAEPQKIAVGQTHGAEGGASSAKPGLRLVGDAREPAMASAPVGNAKSGATSGSASGKSGPAATHGETPSAPSRQRSSSPKRGSAPQEETPASRSSRGKKGAPKGKGAKQANALRQAGDPIESRLKALEEIPVPAKRRKALEQAIEAVREKAASDPAAAEGLLEGLEDRFLPHGAEAGKTGEVHDEFGDATKKMYPEKNQSGKHTQSVASDDRASLEQDLPSKKTRTKERVRESFKRGESGGAERAAREHIQISDEATAQQLKGDTGRGFDLRGVRLKNGKVVIVENKYGSSKLKAGQMSNEWVGKKIAELKFLREENEANLLLTAAKDGNLQGMVNWTRELKTGDVTSRLTAAQLRGKLPTENIDPSGLIRYAPGKVEKAYVAHLEKLNQAAARLTEVNRALDMQGTASSATSRKLISERARLLKTLRNVM